MNISDEELAPEQKARLCPPKSVVGQSVVLRDLRNDLLNVRIGKAEYFDIERQRHRVCLDEGVMVRARATNLAIASVGSSVCEGRAVDYKEVCTAAQQIADMDLSVERFYASSCCILLSLE